MQSPHRGRPTTAPPCRRSKYGRPAPTPMTPTGSSRHARAEHHPQRTSAPGARRRAAVRPDRHQARREHRQRRVPAGRGERRAGRADHLPRRRHTALQPRAVAGPGAGPVVGRAAQQRPAALRLVLPLRAHHRDGADRDRPGRRPRRGPGGPAGPLRRAAARPGAGHPGDAHGGRDRQAAPGGGRPPAQDGRAVLPAARRRAGRTSRCGSATACATCAPRTRVGRCWWWRTTTWC